MTETIFTMVSFYYASYFAGTGRVGRCLMNSFPPLRKHLVVFIEINDFTNHRCGQLVRFVLRQLRHFHQRFVPCMLRQGKFGMMHRQHPFACTSSVACITSSGNLCTDCHATLY